MKRSELRKPLRPLPQVFLLVLLVVFAIVMIPKAALDGLKVLWKETSHEFREIRNLDHG